MYRYAYLISTYLIYTQDININILFSRFDFISKNKYKI